ncbi:hypothetical protein ABPG72_002133 [Tetrahymena utriculariae]
MHYQRNQFFSTVKKPKDRVTFLDEERDEKLKDTNKKKEEAVSVQEIQLEEKKEEEKQEVKEEKKDQKQQKDKNKAKKQHFRPEDLKKIKDFNKNIDANSLLRRWDVKFLDIKCENLQKEAITIFLVFKIGEKSKVSQDELKNRKEEQDSDMINQSLSQKQYKSELIKEIEKESLRKVKLFIETEIHASYNMLRQRNLVIEVWEYSRWSLNKFLGVKYVKLEQIAQSSINQQIDIRRAGKNASFLRLYFTCYFQEIWDFRLDFENLKGFNTIDDQRKPIASTLKLTLMDDSNPTVKTSEHPQALHPNWGYCQDFIHFRGTMDDLTDNLLQISLAQGSAINIGVLSEDKKTLISLRGIHKFNQLQASIKIKVKNQKQIEKKKDDDEGYEENKLDQLNEEEVYTYIEGRINLNQIPRYIQSGELVRYKKDQQYFCIVINRVSHISAPDDRGLINSYVVISCGNEMKQTRTVKDQMNPDFNEEMVFKIPIIKSTNFFDKVNIVNIVQNQNNVNIESMRDELSKRNEVRFSLWVEGNQITSDDNLGIASFNISELASSFQLEEKEVIDFETKERTKHKIKVGNFTKSFISSRFDASRITISFLAFFLPVLPENIDLRDFSKQQGDTYPYDIRDKMKVLQNDYQSNVLFTRWESKIKETFKQWNLKKNEIAIFLKNIWVKDQYNKLHFICKFLDTFSIQDMSYEDTDETEKQDTVLETLEDLAHYTRCIPFVESDYNDIWYPPDFFLSLRRGSMIDHAILMACLFMGSSSIKKSKEEIKEKDEFPIEDRVFVCLGTNEYEYIVSWIMVFNHNFDSITFWDVKENKKWTLNNRVEAEQIIFLKQHLNPSIRDKKNIKLGLNLLGIKSKKERELEKKLKDEQKKLELQAKLEQEAKEEKRRQEEEQQRQETINQQQEVQKVISNLQQKEPKSEQQKDTGFLAMLNKDDNIKQNQLFSADEVERGTMRRNQIKKLEDLSTQQNTVLEPPKKGSSQTDTFLQSQINDRKTFSKAQQESNQPKKTFLEAHKDDMIQKQDQGELTKFKKVEEFGDREGEFEDLPYKSIQIVFNHKNVYGNLSNQNPTSIFYHLHDPKKWYPYLEGNQQKLGSFYLPSNPYPKMSKQAADNSLDSILSDIKDGISNMRSNEGLQTQWKSNLDQSSKLLKHYARYLEYKDKNRKMKVKDPETKEELEMDFDALRAKFEKDMKNLMPTDYHFQCLPMKFLFIEKSQIRALIEEKAKTFFLLKKKHIIFGINGKIFRYPNKINCLRIVIAMFYSNLDNIQNEKDKDKNLRDKNEIKEEDNEENSNLMDSEDLDEQEEKSNLKKSSKKKSTR